MSSVQTTFKISCLTSFKCSVLMRVFFFFEVLLGPPSQERHETSHMQRNAILGVFVFKGKRKTKEKETMDGCWQWKP